MHPFVEPYLIQPVSFGKAEPGIVSKITEIINQETAGINEGFIFFQ
jgi:hypothetical protein